MLDKTQCQALIILERADKAKAEHKAVRSRLQEKINSLIEAYPPLAEHELIATTLKTIGKRSQISAPSAHVAKDTAAKELASEIERLKARAPAKAIPLFKDIERAVALLSQKTEAHYSAKQELAEAENPECPPAKTGRTL